MIFWPGILRLPSSNMRRFQNTTPWVWLQLRSMRQLLKNSRDSGNQRKKLKKSFRAKYLLWPGPMSRPINYLRLHKKTAAGSKENFGGSICTIKLKASCYFQELSWVFGFEERLGPGYFIGASKIFRAIVLNPTRFRVDIGTVAMNILENPIEAIREYLRMGVDRMSDAPLLNLYDSDSGISDFPPFPLDFDRS